MATKSYPRIKLTFSNYVYFSVGCKQGYIIRLVTLDALQCTENVFS